MKALIPLIIALILLAGCKKEIPNYNMVPLNASNYTLHNNAGHWYVVNKATKPLLIYSITATEYTFSQDSLGNRTDSTAIQTYTLNKFTAQNYPSYMGQSYFVNADSSITLNANDSMIFNLSWLKNHYGGSFTPSFTNHNQDICITYQSYYYLEQGVWHNGQSCLDL